MDRLYALEAEALRSLINQYPYVALYRALLARKLKDSNDAEYDDALRLAALHAPDRVRLYEFLHMPLPGLQEEVVPPVEENDIIPETRIAAVDAEAVTEEKIVAPSEETKAATPTDVNESEIPLVEELKEAIPVEEVIEPQSDIAAVTPTELPVQAEEEESETNELRERLMRSSALEEVESNEKHTFLEWLDIVAHGPVKEHAVESKDDPSIMDRQLEEEAAAMNYQAALQKEASALEEEEIEVGAEDATTAVRALADRSVSMNTGVISETLAKLMLMQGKKTEAIQLYEQLSLKYPEKSDYFAAQIRSISL